MCLTTADLAISYSLKEKAFVGIGYKKVFMTDSSGRINWSMVGGKNKWLEAKGHNPLFNNEQFVDKCTTETVLSSKSRNSYYYPGFHIFLDEKDARQYLHGTNTPSVVKVMYKNIVAFGENFVTYKNSLTGGKILGKCVVAEYMKYLEVID